jgi:hypothetical protein
VLGKKFAGRLWRANPANKELKECLVKKEISAAMSAVWIARFVRMA